MAFRIFPTENDVGSATGEGRWATEANMSLWSRAAHGWGLGINPYLTGLQVTGVGTGNVTIGNGIGQASGYWYQNTAPIVTDISSAGATSEVWFLKLDRVSNLVTGISVVRQGSNTIPGTDSDDYVPLAFVTYTGTAPSKTVATIEDLRVKGASATYYGTYAGDNTNDRLITLPFKPQFVEVRAPGLRSISGVPSIPNAQTGNNAEAAEGTGQTGHGTLEYVENQWQQHIGVAAADRTQSMVDGYGWSFPHSDQIAPKLSSASMSADQQSLFLYRGSLHWSPGGLPTPRRYQQCQVYVENLDDHINVVSAYLVYNDVFDEWVFELTLHNTKATTVDPVCSAAGDIIVAFRTHVEPYLAATSVSVVGSGSFPQFIPDLDSTGFTVSHNTSPNDIRSLNRSGVNYRFMAY